MLKKVLHRFCFFFSVLVFTLPLFSNAQDTYFKTVGNATSDFGISCKPTNDKGTILAMETSSGGMEVYAGLVKADSNGSVQWTKVFLIGEWCIPQNVLLTDGGYMIFGIATDSFELNLNNYYLFLLQTDSLGNEQWLKKIPASACDFAVQLRHSVAGGYIACSIGDYNLGTYPRAVISRFDDDGNIMWQKQYSAPYGLHARGMVELSNGNICFVSCSGSYSQFFFNDVLVSMTDPSGNLLWTKAFRTYYDDEPNAISVNASDEIFITGRSYFMSREWDSFLLKLDANGNKLVSKFYDAGTANGEIMRCVLARDNGTCNLLGDVGTFDERDITLMDLDANGNINWVQRYPFSSNYTNYPYDIYQADDGGYFFTGDVRPPAFYRDAPLVKTDSSGLVECYNASSNFTVYNDSFPDSLVVLTSSSNSPAVLSSSTSIPVNPLTEKLICAKPIPDFSFLADVNCPGACVNFIDESANQPFSWHWQFTGADSTTSYMQNPVGVCYSQPGYYPVTLTISNSNGTKSITKTISLFYDCPDENQDTLFVPNVFTPNGDQANDVFDIKGLTDHFILRVFNRWGEEVFTSSDKSKMWRGKNKSDSDVSDGIYYYTLVLTDKERHGFVKLIR